MYSVVVPVYNTAEYVPELMTVLADLDRKLGHTVEAVFVVDGSPDDSFRKLQLALTEQPFRSRLLLLSRNFGSFAAIREGLRASSGTYMAVMAADLQEPPELLLQFHETLAAGEADVVLGRRDERADPLWSRLAARLFWGVYQRFVQHDMPRGGVDVFACTRVFRDRLLSLDEANSSLVGLLLWMGFRRKVIGYARRSRRFGKSGWTLSRKLRYLSDSMFAFSDLPISALTLLGMISLTFAVAFSAVVVVARLVGDIPVPGYAATVLVITFFAGLNSLGLGIIGSYVWRAFENTKGRPNAIVREVHDFGTRD